MLEDDLNKFYKNRKVFVCKDSTEWSVDFVDNQHDIIHLIDDQGYERKMTYEFFIKNCIFTDELFMPSFIPMTKCECGVDKLGYGVHSDYCPKAAKK